MLTPCSPIGFRPGSSGSGTPLIAGSPVPALAYGSRAVTLYPPARSGPA